MQGCVFCALLWKRQQSASTHLECIWSRMHVVTHTQTHTHTHTQAQTQAQTQAHTDTHTDTHTHRHKPRHTHTDTHTDTQTHTDTHTHRHTQTHTHRHTRSPSRHLCRFLPSSPRHLAIDDCCENHPQTFGLRLPLLHQNKQPLFVCSTHLHSLKDSGSLTEPQAQNLEAKQNKQKGLGLHSMPWLTTWLGASGSAHGTDGQRSCFAFTTRTSNASSSSCRSGRQQRLSSSLPQTLAFAANADKLSLPGKAPFRHNLLFAFLLFVLSLLFAF